MTTTMETADRAELLDAVRAKLPGTLKANAALCSEEELRALLDAMNAQQARYAEMGFVDEGAASA